jgi:hypothetical protein
MLASCTRQVGLQLHKAATIKAEDSFKDTAAQTA